MGRLSFEFKMSGVICGSFDPEEFRGLTEEQIRDALNMELPGTVDPDDVALAASQIAAALA